MGSSAIATRPAGEDIEALLIGGDLSKLNADQRITYYKAVCESVGLNPLTQPFEYLTLSGKLRLYARKDCTDQLRKIHGVSVAEMSDQMIEGVYVVTCTVADKTGRTDIAKGAVTVKGLAGENLANALMKAETKAKRRATLSICGLGMLDETEVEDAPSARPAPPAPAAPAAPKYTPPPKAPAPAAAAATVPAAVTSTPPPPAAPVATDKGNVTWGKAKDDPAADAPMIDSPERVAQVNVIRRMMIDKAPHGLAWHPKHAEGWLKKYFGVDKPIKLRMGQARDVEVLLRARMAPPPAGVEEYCRLLEMFHAEERVLTSEAGVEE